MSAIDFTGLTLTSDEARETADLVFATLFTKPETLQKVHDVRTGVEMDKYIPILGQYGLVGKVDAGGCVSNVEAGDIPVSEKQWLPKLISFRIEHCQADVPDLLKFWKKSRIAAETWSDVDSEMMAFVNDRIVDATYESILRLASFGDTAATNVGTGSGSETITAGVAVAYFTPIDGLWKQIFTDQAGAKKAYRYTISENALTTKVAQMTLATDAAIKALQAMYDNIDSRSFSGETLVFQMTRTLYNNYVATLETKSLGFTLAAATDGKPTPYSYRGIAIQVRYDWDRGIKAWHDLSTTYYLPHRAILTKLTNIPIGTSDEESMSAVTSEYSSYFKKHIIDVAYKIDVKLLVEEELASAY